MTTYSYPHREWLKRVFLEDAYLVLAIPLIVLLHPPAPLATVLLVAIPLVVAFRIVTLHFPSRVTLDDAHLVFFAYGRTHRFAWSEIERVHVRRFLVRDRVLVRITPAPPWRGRYWLTNGIDGYATLVAKLEDSGRPS